MTATRSVSIRLSAEVAGMVRGLQASRVEVKGLQKDLGELGNQQKTRGKDLEQIGKVAGGVGLAAAAGLGAAITASANFDQAMSSVQAATHETSSNMDLLRAAALKAGEDTAFSATEAAAGIEELSKAGVSTADILGGGLSGALSLAAAGNQSVAESAETAASAMTQFKLEGDQVPHIADLLAAGAGKAQGEVSDLAAALNQSGLVAAQTGLSLEETTGTLAMFASAGLLGSDAGTSFKSMLLALNPNSEKAARLMEQLGLSAYDAQGNFIGMEAYAGKLQSALSGMSAEQRNATLKTIFGNDAVRAASILYSQGAEGVAKWGEEVNDAGYAVETAATKLDNLKGDLEALGGSLETALISTGSGSQGPLRTLVQSADDAVKAYNRLPDSAHAATSGLLAAGAALGGSVWLGSKLVRGVAETRGAMTGLAADAPRTARALSVATKALAGFTVGFVAYEAAASAFHLNTTSDEIRRSAELIGAKAGPELEAQIEATKSAIEKYKAIADDKSLWDLDLGFAHLWSDQDASRAADMADGLSEHLAELEHQQEVAAAAAESGADAIGGQASAMGAATGATDENTDALQANVDAMREQRSSRLAGLNAEVAYQASLDDARAALKANGKTLDITTEKGRANRTALYQVAAAWNEQSAAAKNAPGAHRAAIRSFIDLAVKMGMDIDKARLLARRILELPNKRVRVDADTAAARGQVAALDAYLDRVTRPRLVRITTVTNATVADQVSNQRRAGRAYGGHVTAYQRYRVGENGPEEFEAPVSGRIIPNNQLDRHWIGTGPSGASTAPAAASSGGGFTYEHHGDLVAMDPRDVVREQEQRFRDALALVGTP